MLTFTLNRARAGRRTPVVLIALAVLAALPSMPAHAKPRAANLLACDFNGDGFADQPIGAPGEDRKAKDQGAVTILYGGKKGLTAKGDQVFSQSTRGIAGKPRSGENFGRAVLCGNFDNDRYGDLVMAVPHDDLRMRDGSYRRAAGSVHVLYGSAHGLRTKRAQWWHLDRKGVPGKATKNGRFGAVDRGDDSITIGDFNGDRRDDLAVGSQGGVNIFYGGSKGLSARGAHRVTPKALGSDLPHLDYNETHAGDFNGDGFSDLALTERYSAEAPKILWGSREGLRVKGHQTIRLSNTTEDGRPAQQYAAAGDLNGDGFDDLVARTREWNEDEDDYDVLNILYGSPAGVVARDQGIKSSVFGGRYAQPDVVGDVNGDGYGDLLLVTAAARSVVLYGSKGGVDANDSQKLKVGPGAVGDRNGDGVGDLSAMWSGNEYQVADGIRVFLGARDMPLSAKRSKIWTQDTRGVRGTSEEGDAFSETA